MAEDKKDADQLLVAAQGDAAYMRLINRGSFRNSKALKQFGSGALEGDLKRFVIDMTECVGMDSTFMGVLAGLAFRLKQRNGGRLYLINLSPRTRGLLATLGLDQLVETHMSGTPLPSEVATDGAPVDLASTDAPQGSQSETAELMLDAHQELVNLHPENLPRFKDVLAFLREDVEKAKARESAAD